MYDLEPTEERKIILRAVRDRGDFVARLCDSAYYSQILRRPMAGFQEHIQDQLDTLEREGLIGHEKAQRDIPAKYFLTPKGLRLLGE
jgi:DNA-binding HxlR family transcriptional regulator